MTVLTSKACIVGEFAVGKTSTVERFVNQQFSDKYLTTVGVKIDTKEIELPRHEITQKLVLWDVAGTSQFGAIEFSYLRGTAGVIYVADGTRPDTLDVALDLRKSIEDKYGPLPCVLLLNKCDLTNQWGFSEEVVDSLREEVGNVFVTSAKTGECVEQALETLAAAIADAALGST